MQSKNPKIQTEKIRALLESQKIVKFTYLFGSQATGKARPLSDMDIGVYLDGRVNPLTCRLKLLENLARITNDENIEIVALSAAPPLLNYEVIRHNHIIEDNVPRRVIFEMEVLRDYLDTIYLRQIHRKSIKEKIRLGDYFC